MAPLCVQYDGFCELGMWRARFLQIRGLTTMCLVLVHARSRGRASSSTLSACGPSTRSSVRRRTSRTAASRSRTWRTRGTAVFRVSTRSSKVCATACPPFFISYFRFVLLALDRGFVLPGGHHLRRLVGCWRRIPVWAPMYTATAYTCGAYAKDVLKLTRLLTRCASRRGPAHAGVRQGVARAH